MHLLILIGGCDQTQAWVHGPYPQGAHLQEEEMDITLSLSFALPILSLHPLCLFPINTRVTRPVSTASINKS